MKRWGKIMAFMLAVLLVTDLPCQAAGNQSDSGQMRYGSVALIQEGALAGVRSDQMLADGDNAAENQQRLRARAADGDGTAERRIRDAIYNGLMAMDEAIDLSGYDVPYETFSGILQTLVNSSAELFHVSGQYSVGTNSGGDIVRTYYPQYAYSRSKVVEMRERFDAVAEKILSCVNPEWDDREKALYVHDYLASQYEYDTTYTRHDAYSLLVEGTAVCQGYTLAFAYFMQRMGIPCMAVPSSEMNHIWNQVQIGGSWYHVDVTYDDPSSPDMMGAAKHLNFLLSDAGIQKTGHKGWEGGEVCSESTYDAASYFWKASDAPFLHDGTHWYFVINRGGAANTAAAEQAGVYRWKPAGEGKTGEWEMLVDLSQEKWYIDGSQYYLDKYTGLGVNGGVIYFNTAKGIRYFSATSPDDIKTLELPAFTGSIFGMRIKNQALEYVTGRACNALSDPETAKELEGTDPGYEWPKPVGTPAPSAAPVPVPGSTGEPVPVATPAEGEPGEETANPAEVPSQSPAEAPTGNPAEVPSQSPAGVPTGNPAEVSSQSPSAMLTGVPSAGATAVPAAVPSKPAVQSAELSVKPASAASGISVAAKRGAKKLTVRTAARTKVVISMNKKIIKNGKKTCKKLTVTANRNKTGKIVVKLSSRLKKKMKITVVVYVPGGTRKKTVLL